MINLTNHAHVAEVVRKVSPDRVFHLASDASVAHSWLYPETTFRNNVASTYNVLEALRHEAPEARILIACSAEEYGPVRPERQPIAEEEPLRPQNPYAVSKAAVDPLGGFYADAHSLPVVRGRAFHHAGPGQGQAYVVSALARQVGGCGAGG